MLLLTTYRQGVFLKKTRAAEKVTFKPHNKSRVKYSLFFVSPYLPDLASPQFSPALGPLKGFLKTFGNINKLPSYSVT